MRPTQIAQGNLPILNSPNQRISDFNSISKIPFPYQAISIKTRSNRKWVSFGECYSAYHSIVDVGQIPSFDFSRMTADRSSVKRPA